MLGPLQMIDDGRALALGGPKQRSLLGLLLLNANRVVSADRLIEAGRRRGGRTLQVYVSNLRKLLELRRGQAMSRTLVTKPRPMLRIETAQSDLLRFRRVVGRGRAAWEEGPGADGVSSVSR